MRTRKPTIVSATLLAATATLAATTPAHATTADPTTVTTCSAWKLSGTHNIQSCIDITGTQVHTYAHVTATVDTPADLDATLTGHVGNPGTRLPYQPSTVHLDTTTQTALLDGTTTTATPGTPIRATLYLPHTLGTGTVIAPDNGTYLDPDVPTGPAGPSGHPSTLEQITVWATVSG